MRRSQDSGTGDYAAARAAWFALVASGLLGERGLVRVSRNGGVSYPGRYEHPVATHPAGPAACYVYNSHGLGRMLVADFDTKRHHPWQAAADAAGFRMLIERCGGTSIEDLSPTGGRHVYVPFTAPLPFTLLKRIAEALHLRMTGPLWHGTFDKSPMMNATDGLIRPPGSPHPSGGYQTLVTPLDQARLIAVRGNDRRVWGALLADLAPELEQITVGVPHTPSNIPPVRGALRRDLPPCYDAIARTGRFDPARYPSRSEARLAVLRAVRTRGWSDLDEVIARTQAAGPWPGLAELFAKYRNPTTRRRQWERDWAKAALPFTSRSGNAAGSRDGRHNYPTRQEDTPPCLSPTQGRAPIGPGAQPALHASALGEIPAAQIREWGFIRCALQAVYMAEACGRWDGRGGQSVRLVLRAAGRAAMLRGSRFIAFGTRFLGLDSLLDHTTVARAMRRLREEDDPFLVLIEADRGVHGDLYEWRIPRQFVHTAAYANPLAGKIDAIHPAFRSLGISAALLYEALDATEAMPIELARTTRLSVSGQRAALRLLEQVGLAERGERGWRRGHTDLDALARSLGADQVHRDTALRWAVERAAWQAACTARATISTLDAPDGSESERDEELEAWRQALELSGPPPDPPSAPVPTLRTETPSAQLDRSPEAPVRGALARRRTAYRALPDLQRAVLCELFHADQAAEREEKAREAAGERSRKAYEWRALEVTPASSVLAKALASLAPWTQIGDAIDELRRAGLLERSCEETVVDACVTVRINRRARAIVRAGLELPMTPKRRPGLLSAGLWQCLQQVADAEPHGLPRERLWGKAHLHLAEGTYQRPGKNFIAVGCDGRWHLTDAGHQHIDAHQDEYARYYLATRSAERGKILREEPAVHGSVGS